MTKKPHNEVGDGLDAAVARVGRQRSRSPCCSWTWSPAGRPGIQVHMCGAKGHLRARWLLGRAMPSEPASKWCAWQKSCDNGVHERLFMRYALLSHDIPLLCCSMLHSKSMQWPRRHAQFLNIVCCRCSLT